MSGDASRKPKRSWRDTSAPAPSAKGPDYKWKDRRAPESKPKPAPSKSWRVVKATVACLAAVGVIVWLIIMLGPSRPAAVVLVEADYATNLRVPHNVYGVAGAKGLERQARQPKSIAIFPSPLLRLAGNSPALERPDQWDTLIAGVRKSVHEKTVVFYLALHGATDSKGAYFLPNLASKPDDRLELQKVIRSMGELPPEQNKVLILEGTLIPADWGLGMLHNDFARRLIELEPEIAKVPNLWVLSACDADQRSWVSDGLRRTIFSHYVIEGFRGKAAGSDGKITLDELHQYVRAQVRSYAWHARGAIQEPVLLPRVNAAGQTISADAVQKAAKDVFLAAVGRVPADVPPKPAATAKLEQAWAEFGRMARAVPAPAVYSPRRWRHYRAALVRYDELTRAGATDAAEQMETRLLTLQRAIAGDRFLTLPASVENTLAMNAARGGRLAATSSPPPDFARFWNAPESDLGTIWRALQASEGEETDGREPSLRSRLDDFLLRQATADPVVRNVPMAATRFEVTRGSSRPQPAEAHFLLMLSREVPLKDRPAHYRARVAQALDVRRLAEQTALSITETANDYHYPEQLQPWVRSSVEEADAARRHGEDLLFTTEEPSWQEAAQSLNQAKVLYTKAAERATKVRAALAARDRAMADLPEYASWVPQRQSSDLKDGLDKTMRELWDATHELSRRLAEPKDDADLEALEQSGKALSEGVAALGQRLVRDAQDIGRERGPEDWESATAAAAVAVADNDELSVRKTLWKRLANIERKDEEIVRTLGPDSAPAQKESLPLTRQRARLEALMALAMLGPHGFDDAQTPFTWNFDQTWDRMADLESHSTWLTDLAALGDHVGKRLGRFSETLDQSANADEVNPGSADLSQRWTAADIDARRALADVGATTDPVREPSGRLRALRVHDLLLWMARRTWLDHWWDREPTNPPYYRVAGLKYVDDALELLPRSPAAADSRKQLEAKDRLDFAAHDPIVLTSEQELPLMYRLTESGTVPPGTPVVTASAGSLLKLEPDEPNRRVSLRRQEKAKDQVGQAVQLALTSPELREMERSGKGGKPRVEQSTVAARGFFRGQVFESVAPVEIHAIPEKSVVRPAAPDGLASVAARADRDVVNLYGEGSGAIAIVLDCSGSMNDRGKFAEAKQALISVLRSVPRGTAVSLWIFGQSYGGRPAEAVRASPSSEDLADDKTPERTIRSIRKPARWEPEQCDALEATLAKIMPCWRTPLAEAMRQAKADLVSARGFKTLLVLTDGNDSEYVRKHPGRDIPSFVRETFAQTGIMVNMVCFKTDEKELADAKAQFAGVIKELDPPGTFNTATDAERLLALLRRSLKQKLTCRILTPNGALAGEVDVTAPEEAERWWLKGLEPGSYTLEVVANRTYRRGIDLERGGRLIAQLNADPRGGLLFERALYGDPARTKEPTREQKGWQVAVLENHGDPDGNQLELFACLEPLRSGEGNLRQVKPRATWFELGSESATPLDFALRVRERGYYPGPVWQLSVPQWPIDKGGMELARPVLKVWWNPAQNVIPSATLKRGGDFSVPGDLDHVRVPVEEEQTVTIESVRTEDHYVETKPDAPPELQPCLVVRLSYPPGNPYWVDAKGLVGLNPSASEHRFYERAGKYTGLFWPVPKSQAEERLNGLSLVSLSKHRGEAKAGGHYIELPLSRPRRDDRRPPSPEIDPARN